MSYLKLQATRHLTAYRGQQRAIVLIKFFGDAKKHRPNGTILVSQRQCDVGSSNLRFELFNYDVAGFDSPVTQTNTVAPGGISAGIKRFVLRPQAS